MKKMKMKMIGMGFVFGGDDMGKGNRRSRGIVYSYGGWGVCM